MNEPWVGLIGLLVVGVILGTWGFIAAGRERAAREREARPKP